MSADVEQGRAATSFSYRRIWWLASGVLGVQLAFAAYNAFLPLMYREFFASRAAVGLLMGTDNLVGLLLIPVVGAWSDRTNGTMGRRLPFIVAAVPVAALTLIAIPFAAAMLWTLIVTEVAFTAAMHAYRGPLTAMIVDHTPPRQRSTASGIAQLLGSVGVLISFTVLSLLYDVDPRLTFGAAAGVLLAGLLLMWWQADPRPPYVDSSHAAPTSAFRDTRDAIRALQRPDRRGVLAILASLLTAYMAFAGLQAMLPIYGVETLGLSEGRAAFMLSAFAATFLVSALGAGMLGTRFGAIPTMLGGLAGLSVLYSVAILARGATSLTSILALAGVAWPMFAVPAVAIVADLGGRDRIGFLIGMYYVFIMTGQMVGPFVLGLAMDLLGAQGMWLAAAALTLLAMVFLRAGRGRIAAERGASRGLGVQVP